MSDDLRLLSLNQATTKRLTIPEVVELCTAHGLGGVGLWRDRIAETGAGNVAKIVRDTGLAVTSVCRGGFFTSPGAIEENRAAIRETADVGCAELVLVCGGLPNRSRDLAGARARVTEAIAILVPYAADHGVRLAIEPMHPIFASDRSVVTTLAQALDIAEHFEPAHVGVVVDSYHVWWDPDVEGQIQRAGDGGRIASYQISDWQVPLPNDPETGNLLGRVHVGDGVIDFSSLTRWVGAAGYRGFVEVEIFNADLWNAPGDDVVQAVVRSYRGHLPHPLPWTAR